MAITYCSRWFPAKSLPIGVIDAVKARDLHERRLPYVAVIEAPRAIVEAYGDYFGVGFLDSKGREYLSYQFKELEPNRLFLTMATSRNFYGGSTEVASGTTYYFKVTGHVTIQREDFEAHVIESKEVNSDVSNNWEDYPEFGQYENLLKIER